MLKALVIFFTALSVWVSPAFASGKPAPKVDCSVKKNANKIECKKAPTSNVKAAVKKPEKVDRKAPKSVQKKAEQAKK